MGGLKEEGRGEKVIGGIKEGGEGGKRMGRKK